MRSKTKSKQIRPQSVKLQVVYQKRTQPLKILQKIQDSPLRPSSQDFHSSLNHIKNRNHYVVSRDNFLSEKKNSKRIKSQKSDSKDKVINNFEADQQQLSKQKIKSKNKIPTKEKRGKAENHSIKIKQDKQLIKVRTSNKEKEKSHKQPKENRLKHPSCNYFIGTKLRKSLQNYLLFINLINYSLKIRYKTPQQNKYTVYIGKGNNSRLVKKIFANRFWWNIVTKEPTNKRINLVWSQWSKPNVFETIPKSTRSSKTAEDFSNNANQLQESENYKNCNKNRQAKSRETFLRKLACQSFNPVEHFYDLLQVKDKKLFYSKAAKKELKYEDIKQLTSKQATKSFKKMNVQLTHNHVQNHQQFTNKKNLFLNLRQFYQDQVFDIVPMTYHVKETQSVSRSQTSLSNVLKILEQQIEKREENKKDKLNLWIVKPGQSSNRGCGIEVFKKVQHIKDHIEREKEKHPSRTFIIQKYLSPFLYHRRKFDIRCYLLITATPQIRAYYYPTGYIRTSSFQFSAKNCSNKFIHLTNDAIQKKQDDYGKYEKGNKVTYDQFQKYLDLFENKKQLNFHTQILPQIQQMMLKTVKVMVSKNKDKKRILNPQNRNHSFQLFGWDFMIDDNFRPWLIEINTNPCLQTGCEVLQKIIPKLIENVIKLSVDTAFPPPRLQEWPLNEILACPEVIFQNNQFRLIFSESEQ